MTSTPSLSTSAILDRLSLIRTSRLRLPSQVSQLGQQLVRAGWTNKDTDQAWIVKEQIAFGCIESGQLELASVLIDRLEAKYQASPRVVALRGALLEGEGKLSQARELYETRLKEKETDVVIRKRLITLHLSTPLDPTSKLDKDGLSRREGIELLISYLDTSYIDAEAWILLSRSYSELGIFEQALSSLNHAVLLQPQNPFILLQHAELNVTIGEYEIGLKEFLRVVEMSTELEGGKAKGLGGCGRRAALGAKMCISRLRTNGKSEMGQETMDKLELVLTEQVLRCYEGKGKAEGEELRVMREWLASR